MNSKNIATLKQLVKEAIVQELVKEGPRKTMLRAEARPLHPAELPKFGAWVKRKFENSIPTNVDDKDVFDYIKKNPKATKSSLDNLRMLFINKQALGPKLDTLTDKELTLAPGADEYYQRGETTLQQLGDELGLTRERIRQVGDTAIDKLKKLVSNPKFNDFIDTIMEEAAAMFVKLLAGTNGDLTEIQRLLKNSGVSTTGWGTASEEEAEGVKYLAKLVKSGRHELAKEMLLTDIEDDSNLFKSYQNLVAGLANKEANKQEIEAGTKRGRGRPELSDEEKARRAAERKNQ